MIYIPVVGHSKHCPFEAYATPESSKQHWLNEMESFNDIEPLPISSPSQLLVLKHTGAINNKNL